MRPGQPTGRVESNLPISSLLEVLLFYSIFDPSIAALKSGTENKKRPPPVDQLTFSCRDISRLNGIRAPIIDSFRAVKPPILMP